MKLRDPITVPLKLDMRVDESAFSTATPYLAYDSVCHMKDSSIGSEPTHEKPEILGTNDQCTLFLQSTPNTQKKIATRITHQDDATIRPSVAITALPAHKRSIRKSTGLWVEIICTQTPRSHKSSRGRSSSMYKAACILTGVRQRTNADIQVLASQDVHWEHAAIPLAERDPRTTPASCLGGPVIT